MGLAGYISIPSHEKISVFFIIRIPGLVLPDLAAPGFGPVLIFSFDHVAITARTRSRTKGTRPLKRLTARPEEIEALALPAYGHPLECLPGKPLAYPRQQAQQPEHVGNKAGHQQQHATSRQDKAFGYLPRRELTTVQPLIGPQ